MKTLRIVTQVSFNEWEDFIGGPGVVLESETQRMAAEIAPRVKDYITEFGSDTKRFEIVLVVRPVVG